MPENATMEADIQPVRRLALNSDIKVWHPHGFLFLLDRCITQDLTPAPAVTGNVETLAHVALGKFCHIRNEG